MVEALVRRARLRFVMNEALGQLTVAAAAALGGLSLLLILGTRYLDWWTLIPLTLAALAWGAFVVWRHAPAEYATAVRVDRNAGLHDVLSTAFHFSGDQLGFAPEQRLQAEAAARDVNLESAVPFTMPRSLYAMAALALLVSALIAVRFFSVHGLDLRPPVTEIMFEDSAARPRALQKQPGNEAIERRRLETAESLLAKFGIPLNPEDQKQTDALDKAIDQALESPGNAGAKLEKGDSGKQGNALDQNAAGDPLEDKEQAGQNAKAPEGKNGAGTDKAGSKNGSDSSGLLSKLKDAVSDMFSKAAQSDAGGQKGKQQQPAAGSKSEKGAGQKSAQKGQEQGQNQSDSEDGEPNGDAQQGQQADGKAGAKSSQASSQAGNGVGSQDGSKDLRAAEQLKAMGKISEIIGKRAATVTGETTIEVQSGRQVLRTEYSKKSAAHGEIDSGSGRDEIPVSLQNYVRQYFEQVRKAPAKKQAPAQ